MIDDQLRATVPTSTDDYKHLTIGRPTVGVMVNEPTTAQAIRHNQNKRKLSIILDAPHALNGLAEILEFGAAKYARGNFKKGFPYTEITDSMLRHLVAFQNGEDADPESGLPHVGHILCNALFLAETFYTKPEFDDRVEVNV